MTGWYLFIALLLLLANAFFVAAEFGLIAARRSKIQQLAEEGHSRARVALRAVRELSFMLAGAQLGITMASLGLGAIAEPAVAHLVEGALGSFIALPEGLLHSVSFVIALTIVVFFHMVIGEMAPKNVAIAEPEKTALWLAIPFRAYVILFKPFIRFLNLVANAGVRVLGVEPQDELRSVHSVKEISVLISDAAKGGMMDEFEHDLLAGAVAFGERDAASVMVPRTEMTAFPSSITPIELEGAVLATGHSRFPIYGESLDNMLGFFHAKDLLRVPPADLEEPLRRDLIREFLVVPESRKLHPLLLDMRRQRTHFALVIDEHGGTSGVVTLEDLLEELVGDILDEYDVGETDLKKLAGDRHLMPGTVRIDEAEARLGISLPEGPYETIAGFLMDRLGRIPKRRDVVRYDGWVIRVRSMHKRRVVEVLVERDAAPAPVPATDATD